MEYDVYTSSLFRKSFNRLDPRIQVAVDSTVQALRENYLETISERFKSFSGLNRNIWRTRCRGTQYRLAWEWLESGDIGLWEVGTHNEIDEFKPSNLPAEDKADWEAIATPTQHGDIEEEIPVDEKQHVYDDYAYASHSGTKSILDNIVELTPSQQALVELSATGPVLIRGVAGSGKTSLGLHRARHIAQLRAKSGEDTSILMLTRTRALKTAIAWLSAYRFFDLASEVFAFGDWMVEQLQKSAPSISENRSAYECIRQIRTQVSSTHPQGEALSTMSSSFLLAEINDVIRGRDVASLEDYLSVKRTGRRSGLNPMRRELVWIVYQKYVQSLREQNKFDWAELPQLVLKNCHPLPRYDVVVVDEAQDLRPNYLNLATRLVKDYNEHRSVTLLGDTAQSIQYHGVSWRDARLPLRGHRTRVLRDNHRNSRQILNVALPILEKCRHLGSVSQYHSPKNIGKSGDKPVLVRYKNLIPVVKYIAREIDRLSKNQELDLDYSNFAILSPRTRENSNLFNQLWMDLSQLGIPCLHFRDDDFMAENEVGLVTMQSAAGLEFPIVFIIDFEEGTIPYRGPSSTPREVIEDRARRLAYVGMTRASERLYLVYHADNPSCFISDVLEHDRDAVEIVDL